MKTDLTIYDRLSDEMMDYLYNNGWHFNKNLCEFAVSKMYKTVNDKKVEMKPYTKKEVDDILDKANIELDNPGLYDYVYVANMCKFDFLGSSVSDEFHLAKYVKDVVDDTDGYDGIVFSRWFMDTRKKGITIYWEDMI